MDQQNVNLNTLLKRLEMLVEKQESFSQEIDTLKKEIQKLQHEDFVRSFQKEIDETPATKQELPKEKEKLVQPHKEYIVQEEVAPGRAVKSKTSKPFHIKADVEKFIGENLINKIGIVITVLGVAIGAKYSIDHDLLSPLTRIILGYIAGLALLGVGVNLKRNFPNYSAVLVSGAMTIMYFITFSAYSFYALIPFMPTFLLMVFFTTFTVIASLSYNRMVISLIGLVGAYAVPFLLSDNSGNVRFLFTYMTIINFGILVIAFRKYWKILYYASFLLTWMIFAFWFVTDYEQAGHFSLALIFSFLFFLTFYITFLAYKLLKKEAYAIDDIILLIINSFVYYGIGYVILEDHEVGEQLLGLFTIGNALIHFIATVIVFRQKLSDRNLFYFISGLVLVFITIAVAVQLDGRWVTLVWIGEAALLFWIGRTKGVPFYEILSYPLILLAFFSLLQDWALIYNRFIPNEPEAMITPILNVHFLASILFFVALAGINFLYAQKKYTPPTLPDFIYNIVRFCLPGMLIFTLYFALRMEVENYWNQLFTLSTLEINQGEGDYLTTIKNYSLRDLKSVWLINYSLLFFTVLSLIIIYKIKNEKLALINLAINAFTLLVFLTHGLYTLSELRESYLTQAQAEYYDISSFNLSIRYLSYIFVIALIYISYLLQKQTFVKTDLQMVYQLATHLAVLWILSSELIHVMDIAGTTASYKLGISILWGAYSLFLIIIGIWKKLKYLRVAAISLFACTLVKLFAYDISHLDTIPKTIVLVSLGVLLLIISFLYNKYKHKIADDH